LQDLNPYRISTVGECRGAFAKVEFIAKRTFQTLIVSLQSGNNLKIKGTNENYFVSNSYRISTVGE